MNVSKDKKIILGLTAAVSLLVPLLTLFREGNYLYYAVQYAELHSEWIELIIIAVLSFAINYRIKSKKIRYTAITVMILVFAYLHSTLIPAVLSLTYLLALSLTGDLIVGVSIVIIEEAVLSLLNLGTAEGLRIAVAISTLIACVIIAVKNKGALKKFTCSEPDSRLAVSIVLIVFLMNLCRLNITLDFDSLWYGLRSDHVLAPTGDIFENLGLAGMVYTYSKGFEILTLPLSGLRSHAYILCFNLWIFIVGLKYTYKLSARLSGKRFASAAVILTSVIPGIANMAVSAKSDMFTWVLQIMMLECFFAYVDGERNFWGIIPYYLLSLTMKPTSVVFSTALFGMMLVYAVYKYIKSRTVPGRISVKETVQIILSVLALIVVWARTVIITGVPFTSVFTGILEKLGFTLKYPFSSRSLPQNYQEKSPLLVMADRVCRMLLSPAGKDMSHVLIAWGGSILFFLIVVIVIFRIKKCEKRTALRFITVPFVIVNLVSLAMLYQVDGNYYMTLYSLIIVIAVYALNDNIAIENMTKGDGYILSAFLSVLVALQLFIMTATNWASVVGFTPISLNKGLYNHKNEERIELMQNGSEIYTQLAENNGLSKVVAFGYHPDCLKLPCIVQSYNDITSPWGNVELVNTADEFIRYLEFYGAEYIYCDDEFLNDEDWYWAKGLVEEMNNRGLLTDIVREGSCFLARVSYKGNDR